VSLEWRLRVGIREFAGQEMPGQIQCLVARSGNIQCMFIQPAEVNDSRNVYVKV
jgi:hypothetical protein